MMDESVLVLGTGALATLFAARLSRARLPVTILGGWREGLSALRQHGARLVEANGEEHSFPLRVAESPQDCRGARFALVLVKAWRTGHAAQQLNDCLAQDGLALTLQNGLGNRELLAEVLGSGRVALGVTTTGATLLAPGRVRFGGEGSITLEAHPRLAPLEIMLRAAQFEVHRVEDAQSILWGKLVVNAAINPLTALLRVSNGGLLERPSACSLMASLAQEVAAVARALDIHLPFDDPVEAAQQVARRTATNQSSMLQDVLRLAPTEIDAICGAVVRAGERTGVPTPVNHLMWLLVRSLGASSV